MTVKPVLAFLGTLLCLFPPAHSAAGEQQKPPEDHKQHEGAISITGEGMEDAMTVLGGELGRQTVDGMDVGLFVLQAESPERLAPGAKGPTHVFHLTFIEEGKKGLLEEVEGAVLIEGPGEPQKVAFQRHDLYQRAVARLELEGDYRIRVEFDANGHKGRTEAFPFRYQRKKQEGHRH